MLTRNAAAAVIRTEPTGTETASAKGITAHGATPVLALCRKLIAAGHDPAAPLIAYRNTVLALRARSISEAATLDLNSKGIGFVRCRQAVRTGLPIAPKPPTLVASP